MSVVHTAPAPAAAPFGSFGTDAAGARTGRHHFRPGRTERPDA